MAALCDIFVNDAFGTAHRAEAHHLRHRRVRAGRLRRPAAGRRDRRHHAGAGRARSARWWPSWPAARCRTKLTILQALSDKVDGLIVGGGIANTFMLAAGLKIGKSLAEPDLVGDAKAVIEAMKARGAAVPIPTDVVVRQEVRGRRRGHRQGGHRRRRRRPDPGHRPADRGAAGRAAQGGRHHRLERPGGRVRVRRVRARHRDAGARHRRQPGASASPAAATRWRPSPSTASRRTSATSPPAAARSWRSSKARSCRRSRSWRSAPADRCRAGGLPGPPRRPGRDCS